jgi:hypothetical protein
MTPSGMISTNNPVVDLVVYRVSQEDRSVFLGVISVGHCEKRNSYEQMSNSEWL